MLKQLLYGAAALFTTAGVTVGAKFIYTSFQQEKAQLEIPVSSPGTDKESGMERPSGSGTTSSVDAPKGRVKPDEGDTNVISPIPGLPTKQVDSKRASDEASPKRRGQRTPDTNNQQPLQQIPSKDPLPTGTDSSSAPSTGSTPGSSPNRRSRGGGSLDASKVEAPEIDETPEEEVTAPQEEVEAPQEESMATRAPEAAPGDAPVEEVPEEITEGIPTPREEVDEPVVGLAEPADKPDVAEDAVEDIPLEPAPVETDTSEESEVDVTDESEADAAEEADETADAPLDPKGKGEDEDEVVDGKPSKPKPAKDRVAPDEVGGDVLAAERFLLGVDDLDDIKAFIATNIQSKFLQRALTRLVDNIENSRQGIAGGGASAPGKKPVKKDPDYLNVEDAFGGFEVKNKQVTTGLLARAIKNYTPGGNLGPAKALLGTIKKQMDAADLALYPAFIERLNTIYGAKGNDLFVDIRREQEREERLITIPKIKLRVEKEPAPAKAATPGPTMGGAPPPPPPPPPAPSLGGGPPPPPPPPGGAPVKARAVPFAIKPLAEIVDGIRFDEGTKTLFIRPNTLKDMLGSWLQDKANAVRSSNNITALMQMRNRDLQNVQSIPALVTLIDTMVEDMVRGEMPLFRTTEELNEEILIMLERALAGKVDTPDFDGSLTDSLREMIANTIQTKAVEDRRLDYVANRITRNLKASGMKDEIKDLIRSFQASSDFRYEENEILLLNAKTLADFEGLVAARVEKADEAGVILGALTKIKDNLVKDKTPKQRGPVKTAKTDDRDVENIKAAFAGYEISDPNFFQFFARAIKGQNIESARALLSTHKPKMAKMGIDFNAILERLDGIYASQGNRMFSQILAAERREAMLIDLPTLRFQVKAPDMADVPGPSAGGAPPPPPPPPPAPSMGGAPPPPPPSGSGVAPVAPQKFPIKSMTSILAEVGYKPKSKTLIIGRDTMTNLFGSWLQERANAIDAPHDINALIRKKRSDIRKITNVDGMITAVKGMLELFVSEEKPLYATTEVLNHDLSNLIEDLLEGVDDKYFENDKDDAIRELVGRSLKPQSVEEKRLDYIATKIGQNVKISGQKDQIKRVIGRITTHIRDRDED